ncbi:MAG TPA: helix-hairpin-helix domain-containing protein [Thermoanaerobaculia bacterium]|nr:helix-hairpin-helix domain-containing protein [Thermoanaerobaculia bacterium]
MRKSLSFATLTFVLLSLAGSLMAADAAEAPASKGVVNINTADAAQLSLLPRVGPRAAERIVEYRKANGGFKKTTDLMQVKGIGDKTFELIAPYIAVEGKTTLSSKVSGPKKPRASKNTSR